MAKDTLIARLNESADAEITEILRAAEDDVASIKKEAESQLKQYQAETQAELDRRVEAVKRQANADVSRELRALEVQKRRKLMNEVRGRVLASLSLLEGDARVSLLASLVSSVDAVEGEVVPAPGFTKDLKKAVKQAGAKFKVADEDVSLSSGFQFISGALTIDASLEQLVDSAMESHESEVAGILFRSGSTDSVGKLEKEEG